MDTKKLEIDKKYKIKAIFFDQELKKRFYSIGFIRNEVFKVIRKNSNNSIFLLEIKGTMFALRKNELELIEVISNE